jgi:hypothetical protein
MTNKTIFVNNATELAKAAKGAVGGDTILLAAGNYGDVSINSLNPNGMVTIKSANPDADAVINRLVVSRSSNFTFEDVDFHNPLRPGETEAVRAVRVQLSNDINFVGVDVYGSLNNNINDDGNGIAFASSSRVSVLDSTFKQLNVAAIFSEGSDVIFAGNTISDVREGVNIAQIDGALVERNFITRVVPDFSRGDHADAIQVHAGGRFTSSNDIVIRSNVIKLGTTTAQGIYINNEKGAQGAFHTNITVEDNYYEGNARHGITVNYGSNLSVHDNTVRDIGTLGLVPAIYVMNSKNAVIDDNIAPLLLGMTRAGNTNTVWSDNIDVWDRLQKVGVADSSLFAAPVGSKDLDFSSLNVRPGSIAAAHGIGFAAIDGIGDIKASASAVMAAYLPQFDLHLAHAVMV